MVDRTVPHVDASARPGLVLPTFRRTIRCSAEKVELGRQVFFDQAGCPRDGSVSCGTCHEPARAFADGRSRSRWESEAALADAIRRP